MFSCPSAYAISQETWLYMVSEDDDPSTAAYLNFEGDTIIKVGQYAACFTDTIKYFGTCYDNQRKAFVAIDNQGEFMYEVFFFDNGPDYIEEGLFRIQEKGLIGFANEFGEIVISPKYEAASYFENGKAKVSYKAKKIQDGEHWYWDAEEWFYIDKKGNRIKE